MMLRLTGFLLLLVSLSSWGVALTMAAEPAPGPLTPEGRAALNAKFDKQIAALTSRLEKAPADTDLLSERGDARFFRGQFAEAVADFDAMVKQQPDLEASHWRRGIACFYAAKYKEAAKQFELYHSFDDVDRENGIWRYLSQVKALGQKKAREGLLKYKKDDREPFPDVYKLFAGELTGEQVLERIRKAEITEREREMRLFYAELYVGLNEFVEEHPESAEKHLRAAVDNRWGAAAAGGPGWMWQVARVHCDVLAAKATKTPN